MPRTEKTQRVINLRKSHGLALQWISNGTKDEGAHKSSDMSAKMFLMIVQTRTFYFSISKDAENSTYTVELKNILQFDFYVSNDIADSTF
jgi:hypothetical protein